TVRAPRRLAGPRGAAAHRVPHPDRTADAPVLEGDGPAGQADGADPLLQGYGARRRIARAVRLVRRAGRPTRSGDHRSALGQLRSVPARDRLNFWRSARISEVPALGRGPGTASWCPVNGDVGQTRVT